VRKKLTLKELTFHIAKRVCFNTPWCDMQAKEPSMAIDIPKDCRLLIHSSRKKAII